MIISWPTPGQGEDLLDDERAADEEADGDASTVTIEMIAVAERVADEHAPLRQPFRPRRRDVVGLEDLEQARAQAADEDRGDPERDGEGRQEHGVEVADEALAVAADGEMTPGVEREREQQHDPDPEGGKAEPDERNGADDVVGRTGRDAPPRAPRVGRRSAPRTALPRPISQSVTGSRSRTSARRTTL